MNAKELKVLKDKLNDAKVKWVKDPDYVHAYEQFHLVEDESRAKYQPEVDALQKEYDDAKKTVKVKGRWPDDTPDHIKTFCSEFWSGTEEYWNYRIHAWNDKIVITSYPNRAWYDNGGRHPGSTRFFAVSLTEKEYGKAKWIKEKEGRLTKKDIVEMLSYYEKM